MNSRPLSQEPHLPHLGGRVLHVPAASFLHVFIGVGKPARCRWHHPLAGILDCIRVERELGSNMHSSLSAPDRGCMQSLLQAPAGWPPEKMEPEETLPP